MYLAIPGNDRGQIEKEVFDRVAHLLGATCSGDRFAELICDAKPHGDHVIFEIRVVNTIHGAKPS